MTRAELDTTYRFDREARRLEACTADPAVARRWRARGFPVAVLGMTRSGQPRTWTLSVPLTEGRRRWIKAFAASIPRFRARNPSVPAATEAVGGPSRARETGDGAGGAISSGLVTGGR